MNSPCYFYHDNCLKFETSFFSIIRKAISLDIESLKRAHQVKEASKDMKKTALGLRKAKKKSTRIDPVSISDSNEYSEKLYRSLEEKADVFDSKTIMAMAKYLIQVSL